MLVRLRLIGGQVSSASLRALADVAGAYGDGRVHLTSRANLQVRALPGDRRRARTRTCWPRSRRPACCRPAATSWSATSWCRRRPASPAGARTCARWPRTWTPSCARPGAGRAARPVPVRPRRRAGRPARPWLRPRPRRARLLDGPAAGRVRGSGPVVPISRGGAAHRGAGPRVRRTPRNRAGGALARRRAPGAARSRRRPDPRSRDPVAAAWPFGAVPGGRHVAVPADGLDRAAGRRADRRSRRPRRHPVARRPDPRGDPHDRARTPAAALRLRRRRAGHLRRLVRDDPRARPTSTRRARRRGEARGPDDPRQRPGRPRRRPRHPPAAWSRRRGRRSRPGRRSCATPRWSRPA